MATSAVQVPGFGSGGQCRIWDIFATADADVALTIAHGILFPSATDAARQTRVTFQPNGAKFYTQNWFVAAIDDTNLMLTKSGVGVGSGDALSQARIFLEFLAGLYA